MPSIPKCAKTLVLWEIVVVLPQGQNVEITDFRLTDLGNQTLVNPLFTRNTRLATPVTHGSLDWWQAKNTQDNLPWMFLHWSHRFQELSCCSDRHRSSTAASLELLPAPAEFNTQLADPAGAHTELPRHRRGLFPQGQRLGNSLIPLW